MNKRLNVIDGAIDDLSFQLMDLLLNNCLNVVFDGLSFLGEPVDMNG